MKYLIVGTGGVGGSIAGFLALAAKNVTCIARGAHLSAMQERGLHLISGLQGDHYLPIPACLEAEYHDKADVIFVCVKAYSLDSVMPLIQKAAHPDTLVIPILNGFGYGDKIEQATGLTTVLDGCVYIVGFVSGAGEITQMGKAFRLVFGARTAAIATKYASLMQQIQADLQTSGIKTQISDNIRRDTFIKWSFISAMACTGAYYNVPMEALQHEGEERRTFAGLSDESVAIGKKSGFDIPPNQTEKNLKVIDSLAPESTASMQKDLERGAQSELNELLFEMVALGQKMQIDMPVYQMVMKKYIPIK
ncbi:MAG: ketopantoate reductase family protein [Candidatus Symbiothrix sp.]|jgi:2-dehydropantoate 2-reductase|nr:ketopantoate reductase family protein [Candidatus Symbiothrix sp.]